ncbi:MAG: KGG domain-containing protein [Pseudomonadota bacterium]
MAQQQNTTNQGSGGKQGGGKEGGGTSNRGFASMDPEKQREIASKGGHAAHEKGTAHEFTSEEAREAGHLGGQARSANSGSSNEEGGSGKGGSSGGKGGSSGGGSGSRGGSSSGGR